MNSPYFPTHGWASGTSGTHLGFADVHQHLDDNSHLLDEMIQGENLAAEPKAAVRPQPKAKVLFQFFDGWATAEL
jgi:hypothetical protein